MVTAAQMVVLEAVDALSQEKGISPCFEEIADRIGVQSKSPVARGLGLLRDQGLVDYLPHKARTLWITAAGRDALRTFRAARGLDLLNDKISRLAAWATEELTAPVAIRDDAQSILNQINEGAA